MSITDIGQTTTARFQGFTIQPGCALSSSEIEIPNHRASTLVQQGQAFLSAALHKQCPKNSESGKDKMAEQKDQENTQDGQKKKKRVIVTPPCPPSVSTGYVILRGVLQGLIGGSMDDAAVSLMQPTFIKENAPTGKFSINLGKKLGSCQLDLPETKEGYGTHKSHFGK
jgi:hypothetical protein